MGVDHEIEVINDGIAEVYRVLYKINYQLDSTLISLNNSLNKVDDVITDGVVAVGNIEEDVLKITNIFPMEATYYIVLLALVFVLYAVIAGLLWCIYKQYMTLTLQSDKIVRKYMKKIYRPIDRRDSLEGIETPPPTYDEYVKTADLYVKYHRNGSTTTSALQSQPAI